MVRNENIKKIDGHTTIYFLGGEDEIRTHGTIARTHAFQACSFNHSDTSPRRNALRVLASEQVLKLPLIRYSSSQFGKQQAWFTKLGGFAAAYLF